jgi:hypothetical protein
MTNLLKKPVTFEKVEFWGATAIYCLSVFILLGQMINADANNSPLGIITAPFADPYGNSENFLPQLLRYTAFYGWFLMVNMIVIRNFIKTRYVLLNIILLIIICVGAALLLTVTDTFIRSYIYDQVSGGDFAVHQLLFKQNIVYLLWLTILLGFYTILKQLIRVYLPSLKIEAVGGRQLINECLLAFALVALLAVFFRLNHAHWTLPVAWCGTLSFGIIFYWYVWFRIIPQVNAKRLEQGDYAIKVVAAMLAVLPFVAVLAYVPFRRIDFVIILCVFNTGAALFVAAPIAWYLNRYRLKRAGELQGLKTELGQSSANLDFLRSQINPHFLFNALNTLYGTALQENAERTGSGIQKLGDMMRFMLQENMQEKISLTREVDYLNNYIDLQKLRTQLSPDILIQTEIDEEIKGLEIAPMLLIPFVENAFKHGISLREPSHIKISLQTRDKVLFFDVSNSIHPKGLNDPERDKSGIGLENVKQRLQLLYPGRHELTVRESAKEFFIHLTVTLGGKAKS